MRIRKKVHGDSKVFLPLLISLIIVVLVFFFFDIYQSLSISQTPHINFERRARTFMVNDVYDVKILNVSYKNEDFLINKLTASYNFNESDVDSLLYSFELMNKNSIEMDNINGFEGVIKDAADKSFVNSNMLVLWKENNLILVFSSADFEEMKNVAGWFDKYEN
jgi:hypothetical protein